MLRGAYALVCTPLWCRSVLDSAASLLGWRDDRVSEGTQPNTRKKGSSRIPPEISLIRGRFGCCRYWQSD